MAKIDEARTLKQFLLTTLNEGFNRFPDDEIFIDCHRSICDIYCLADEEKALNKKVTDDRVVEGVSKSAFDEVVEEELGKEGGEENQARVEAVPDEGGPEKEVGPDGKGVAPQSATQWYEANATQVNEIVDIVSVLSDPVTSLSQPLVLQVAEPARQSEAADRPHTTRMGKSLQSEGAAYSRRKTKPSVYRRSPFVNKTTVVDVGLEKSEWIVAMEMFSQKGDEL